MITTLTVTQIATLALTMVGWVITGWSIDIPTVTPTQVINMVSMGDSNTFWVNLSSDKRYSNKLSASAGITVNNIGINSYKVQDLINQVPTLEQYKDLSKRNVVTIMIGTNDFIAGNTVANTWVQLQTLISSIKSNWWEVWVITYPPKSLDTVVNISIIAFNNLIIANASNWYTVVDAYKEFSDWANGNKIWLVQSDWLHLNDIGNSIIYLLLYWTISKPIAVTLIPVIVQPPSNTYATWNPSDKWSEMVLSNWNLTVESFSSYWYSVRSTIWKSTWKWYSEVIVVSSGIWKTVIWIWNTSANINFYLGSDSNGWSYYNTGKKINNTVQTTYWATYTTGDVIWIALDMTAWTVTFYKNWISQWVAFTWLSGTMFVMVSTLWPTNWKVTANFGATAFAYPIPTGFNSLTN